MKSILFVLLAASSLHAATQITWKRQQLHGDFYSEGAAIGDINGDGKPDVVAGPFWWEGPAFEKKHAYYEPKIFSINGYSDNFFAYVHDFNADQKNDILILGFPGKEARLYLNPGTHDDKPWPMHIVADVVDNESPVFTDITGDGKPEIVCSTAGRFGWFAPNWDKPTEKWPFVAVTEDMKVAKFTHGLGVGDVNGDGKMDLLEARRWWENTTKNEEPGTKNFIQHNFAAGVGGGAQMFSYDFDGNGTNDVFTSLAAHRYGVAVFLQSEKSAQSADKPTWQRVMLASEQPQDNDYGIVFSQPHAAYLADIDGDGIQDIVTGKRYWAHNGHDPDERGHRVIYWYQTKRDGKGGVDFVPHLVDAESGLGVDVQVGDVNGDSLPDIVVGNKAGVFILTQERKDTAADLTPKKLYGPALMAQKDYAKGQSPQDAVKSMQLHGGFKAELIAAEPDLVQPIAFTFDERGRIWVVEGNSYPKPRETGAGQDRIKILEDKDGDGIFETKKIFCEGLNLVSGIELGFGGLWVGAAPYLMFIPDADKDDRADPIRVTSGQRGLGNNPIKEANIDHLLQPQVPGLNFTAYALLDGWGSQDTHETLNSFIWGPDGWLYGCHGVFTHSLVGKPGTPDDQRQPINAGIWRYHPVRHEFEIFAHGTSNPWGLDYDQFGEFFVTACVIPHLYHIVPGGRYQRQAGQHFNPYTYEDIKTIADHAHYAGNPRPNIAFDKTTGAGFANEDTNALGGGHAHCGLAIYQSSLFPPTYRNQLLFGNLHGHRLVANYTDVHGSTYIGKHGADFLRANDMHFIPVTQKVGPDGALYVSDWSDQQICHRGSNAVENWDRSNGRLCRISYDGWKPWKGDLAKESDEALAKLAVQTENEWESRMARRVLMERSPALLAKNTVRFQELSNLVDREIERLGSIPAKLRGEWLCNSMLPLGVPAGVNNRKFANENELIRAFAWRALFVGWRNSTVRGSKTDPFMLFKIGPSPEEFANAAAKEVSSIVRREMASALQRMPNTIVEYFTPLATALLKHGEDKDDPMIPLLIWYGIEPVVAANPAVGMQLAKMSKMPKVTGFIYRRLATSADGREMLLRNLVKPAPAPKKAAEGGKKVLWREKLDGLGEQQGGQNSQLKGSNTLLEDKNSQKGVPTEQKVDLTNQQDPWTWYLEGRTLAKGVPNSQFGGPTDLLGVQTSQFVSGPNKKGPSPGLLGDLQDTDREQVMEQIVQQARQAGRQQPPPDWAELSTALRAGASPRFEALLDELSVLFGDEAAVNECIRTITGKQPTEEVREAIRLLNQIRPSQPLLRDALIDIATCTPANHPLKREAIQSLGILGGLSAEHLQALMLGVEAALQSKGPIGPEALPDAINTLASTKEGAKALLKAMEAKTVPATALSPFLVRQLTAFDDAEINALIKSTWGDVNAPKADLGVRMQKYREMLNPGALKLGDVAKGKMLFTATCGQCHKLFGEGQNVGPDITGSNRADLNYLLENVLDPNAVIGKAYQLNLFTMKDGRVMSGVIKDESPAAVKIAMMGGVEFTLPQADIARREVSKLSTMPEGLFDALQPAQVIDLVKYLQSGSVVPPSGGSGRPAKAGTTIPGAIEGESLKILEITGGKAKPQGMGGFGGEWSGGAQLWWTGGKPDQKLTLALPVKEAGKYTLYGALTKAKDYGVTSIALDGKPVTSSFDGFNTSKVIHTGELDWGTHELTTGEHKLTFTLAPPNPDAVPSNMVGLDYVRLEKK